MAKIKIKRGLKADLPLLDEGELGLCLDTEEVFIGTPKGNAPFASKAELEALEKRVDGLIINGGGSVVKDSSTNGYIDVNGIQIQVYDDTELRIGKHTHANLDALDRLGVNANNKLTLDGIELNTGGTGSSTISDSTTNGNILVNGSEVKVYDDTSINNTLNNKADKTDLHSHTNRSTIDKLSDDGTNLLFNGTPIQGGDGGTIPSNVIYFEDWVGGETVTIDTGGVTPPDTTAPNNVTNLITSNITATSLTLSWTASSSSDVAGYDIYRGSTLLTSVTSTSYSVTGLTEKTEYTLTVKAKDTTGNVASGTSVTVTTADITAPNNVTNLSTSNVTATSLTLSWTASTSTDVTGYEVYNGTALLGTVTGTTYNVSGLTASTAYTFVVKAKDLANNVASGTSVGVTTSAVADTTPPSEVTNLTTSNLSTTSVTLSWEASVSIDVVTYEVYNGTSLIASTSQTSYTVTGLTQSTSYTLTVKAKDGAGNESNGVDVSFTTIAEPTDTAAPVLTITPATTFSDTQTVNMSVNETADIWYTVDGSDPITSGTRVQYTVTVTLTETATVKAYAVDTAGNASAVQTVTYTKEVATNISVYFVDSSKRNTLSNASATWKTMAFLNKQNISLKEIQSGGGTSKAWQLWELDANYAMTTLKGNGTFESNTKMDSSVSKNYAFQTLSVPIELEAGKTYSLSIDNANTSTLLPYTSDTTARVDNDYISNTVAKYTNTAPAAGVVVSSAGFIYDVKIVVG